MPQLSFRPQASRRERKLGLPTQRLQATRKTATTARSLKALDYRRAGKSVEHLFRRNRSLLWRLGLGEGAKAKANRIQINAKFTGLPDSSKFGLEYLTYVLWAISPQGRAVNLGEVINKNGNSSSTPVWTCRRSA